MGLYSTGLCMGGKGKAKSFDEEVRFVFIPTAANSASTVSGTGSVTHSPGGCVDLATGLTINSEAEFQNLTHFRVKSAMIDWGYSYKQRWVFEIDNITTNTVYLERGVAGNFTAEHVGVKIINGRIWISTHDGTTQSLVDTGYSVVNATGMLIDIDYQAGLRVLVYVDNNPAVEKTTNLPTGETHAPTLGAYITNTAGADRHLCIYSVETQYSRK